VSENNALIDVNSAGKLQKISPCQQNLCVVSLIGTHPDSGKSFRVEVKLFPDVPKKETKSTPVKQDAIDTELTSSSDTSQAPEVTSLNENEPNNDISFSVDAIQTFDGEIEEQTEPTNVEENSAEANLADSQQIGFRLDTWKANSGQIVVPEIIYTRGVKSGEKIALQDIECAIEYSDPDVVVIENQCSLRALAPGRASILLKTQAFQLSDNNRLNLEVTAKPISLENISRQAHLLDAPQQQLWFSLTGFNANEVLRLKATGDLTSGFQIFVIPSLDNSQGTCINTVPTGRQQTACIVKAPYEQIFVMLHKPTASSLSVRLSAEVLASKIMDFLYLNNAATPQPLVLNNPSSAFVLANELGLFNRHFYTYKQNDSDGDGIRVLISEFDAPPGLQVFWKNGYCAPNAIRSNPKMVYCDIPADAEGEVSIIVLANNLGGVNNGLAAEQGGTSYQITVSSINP